MQRLIRITKEEGKRKEKRNNNNKNKKKNRHKEWKSIWRMRTRCPVVLAALLCSLYRCYFCKVCVCFFLSHFSLFLLSYGNVYKNAIALNEMIWDSGIVFEYMVLIWATATVAEQHTTQTQWREIVSIHWCVSDWFHTVTM